MTVPQEMRYCPTRVYRTKISSIEVKSTCRRLMSIFIVIRIFDGVNFRYAVICTF